MAAVWYSKRDRFTSDPDLMAELADRAQFKIAGALVQIERKFTKKEGKPFAVVWLEDLTGTLEVGSRTDPRTGFVSLLRVVDASWRKL